MKEKWVPMQPAVVSLGIPIPPEVNGVLGMFLGPKYLRRCLDVQGVIILAPKSFR